MDFEFTAEQKAFAEEVEKFLDEHATPDVADVCRENMAQIVDTPERRAFMGKLSAKGWLGMTWPKEYGGKELSGVYEYILNESAMLPSGPWRSAFFAAASTFGSQSAMALAVSRAVFASASAGTTWWSSPPGVTRRTSDASGRCSGGVRITSASSGHAASSGSSAACSRRRGSTRRPWRGSAVRSGSPSGPRPPRPVQD